MKSFTILFDIVFYEGLFLTIFNCILWLVGDPLASLIFYISFGSLVLAAALWGLGIWFNLFYRADQFEES